MKRLTSIVAVLLAVVLLAGSAGCACTNAGLIAKVNGKGIKQDDFDKEIARYKEQYPTMFGNADAEFRFRRSLLNQMIDAELLSQAADKEGVKVTDEEVAKQIENLKKGFKDQAAFEAALSKSGYDIEQFTEFTRDQMTSQALIKKVAADVTISDEEIKVHYDKNKSRYVRQPYEMIHVAHVLLNDQKTADEVYGKAAGGSDFAGLAKQYSKDAGTASKGGDLGWATMPYAAEFQAAADKLGVGAISKPVKTSFGWHVIKMIEKKSDKQKTLEEVKEQIRQILFQQSQAQSYQNYLQKLRAEAEIEIFDEDLKAAVEGSVPTTGTTTRPTTATGAPQRTKPNSPPSTAATTP